MGDPPSKGLGFRAPLRAPLRDPSGFFRVGV